MRVFLTATFLLFCTGCAADVPQVCFQEECIHVDIAVTDREMNRGLSGRKALPEGQGMLFAFQAEGKYSFWMHEMNFPLDILWLDQDGKVVFLKEELPPCTKDQCPQFASLDNARYVLEVPAGYAKRHGIKLGQLLNIRL